MDLWGQDASFLDTAWVQEQNNTQEDLFVEDARRRCPPGSTEEFIRARIVEEGNKQQVCCRMEVYRKEIVEILDKHLHYHPLTGARPEDQADYLQRDQWEFWRGQVTEMHDFCKSKGLSWAWEYLWKQWYNPRQWTNWARAIAPEVPITNTNAAIESMWARLKKQYLRQHPKASLEFLVNIISTQYIPDRRRTIGWLRRERCAPPWYIDLSQEWRKKANQMLADDDFERDQGNDPEILFTRQQREYHTCIDTWWCGCPNFKSSPNHLCKHLIRFYTQWNQQWTPTIIPIPAHRHVYRQRTSPLLWIRGLHELHQQIPCGLWPLDDDDEPAEPEVELNGQVLAPFSQAEQRQIEIIHDSDNDDDDDEEEEGSDENEGDEHHGGGNSDDGEGEDANERFIREVQSISLDDDIQRTREVKQRVSRLIGRLRSWVDLLEEQEEYEEGHRHLLEIPDPEITHWRQWESFARRRRDLENARVRRGTFAPARRGLIFDS